MSWRAWSLGFVAGAALASWITLSCAPSGAQSAEVAYALNHAADEHGVARSCLWNIARRESRFLPWVTNQRSGAAGLMQFLRTTWEFMAPRAGYAGASPYNAWAATHVAAWGISHPVESQGGIRHWLWC
jgi:soluble lytic murein transglycosylase-like protein